VVPSCTLKFTNQFNYLRSQVAEKFPDQIDNFNRLADHIDEYDDVALEPASYSARQVVSEYLTDPLLTEMLFVPIMYYGNPAEYDMDFTHFAVMCKSIYQQGFSRPEAGMKPVLEMLRKRYEDAGGTLRLRTSVEELDVRNDKIRSIRLAGGEEITADKVFSSAGLVETLRLCSHMPDDCMEEKVGRISFVELIAVLDRPVPSLGIEDTIVFFDSDGPFTFCRPDDLTSLASGVLCFSDNFLYKTPPREGVVRITAKASYPQWRKIVGSDHPRKATEEARADYEARKKETVEKMLSEAIRYVPDFREHIVFTDLFTPLTITRFSRHLGGTVYGSPQKNRTGLTPVSNLFLCGTDQGFLGIVGAMLSGISMANLQCLQ
jgi:phytoene dehydrogenase-like protein